MIAQPTSEPHFSRAVLRRLRAGDIREAWSDGERSRRRLAAIVRQNELLWAILSRS